MKRPLIALIVALLSVACAEADEGVPPDGLPGMRTLLSSGPERFQLQPDGAAVRFFASIDRGDHVERGRVVLELTHGALYLEADADGVLILDELELGIADAYYGVDGSGAASIHLTDIHLRMTDPDVHLATEWAPGADVAYGWIAADWTLQWSMEANGRVHPLADQILHGITMWLTVYGHEDEARFDVIAWNPGPVWSWADIVEFHDLVLLGGGVWMPLVE